MNKPRVRTFADRIRDAVRAFRGKQIGSITFGVDIKKCDECAFKHYFENKDPSNVIYRCDWKACGPECPNTSCDLTRDIEHARNFTFNETAKAFIEKSDWQTIDRNDEDDLK